MMFAVARSPGSASTPAKPTSHLTGRSMALPARLA